MKSPERKDEIRAELVEVRKGWSTLFDIQKVGPGEYWLMRGATEVLDQIAKRKGRLERPDVTYVLRSATTHCPESQIGFHPAKPRPTDWQEGSPHARSRCIDWSCHGARNPYSRKHHRSKPWDHIPTHSQRPSNDRNPCDGRRSSL